jgi:hypothetical protein
VPPMCPQNKRGQPVGTPIRGPNFDSGSPGAGSAASTRRSGSRTEAAAPPLPGKHPPPAPPPSPPGPLSGWGWQGNLLGSVDVLRAHVMGQDAAIRLEEREGKSGGR